MQRVLPWYFTLPLAVLVLLTLAFSAWEYGRTRTTVRELALRQAQELLGQLEQALLNSSLTEGALLEALEDHLFTAAYYAAELHGIRPLDGRELARIAARSGVHHMDLFPGAGESGICSAPGPEGNCRPPRKLDPALYGAGSGEQVLGFYPGESAGARHYGVAVALPGGGAVVATLAAAELLDLRRNTGLGAALRDLQEHEEVRYALIETKTDLLAATADLPEEVTGPRDPLRQRAFSEDRGGGIFRSLGGERLFESYLPYRGGSGTMLRIGLRTARFDAALRRSLWSLALGGALFIALATVLVAWLVSRRTLRYLEGERRRIEAEVQRLEQERELRERLAAMGSLAAGVAHEIRNPLNTISMGLQRLELRDEGPAGEPELLRGMREEAGRIEGIVREFLEFARPAVADLRPDDLRGLLEEVLVQVRPAMEAASVDLDTSLESVPAFRFDRNLLRQALLNLLRNAQEAAAPDGGDRGRVELGCTSGAQEVRVSVADDGPGIPDSERRRVFDLYYSTKKDGAGIGLAVVHRIAAEHGGRVELESRPGEGCRFTLVLPRGKESAKR